MSKRLKVTLAGIFALGILGFGSTSQAAAPGPASVSGNFNPAQGNACQGPNDQPNCPGPQH